MKRTSTVSTPAKKIKPYTYKKKYKKTIPKTIKVYCGRQTFPHQLYNTLRYTEQRVVSAVSGFAAYQYTANGMYDPNITGVGHQPLYYDQLTLIYNHYTVLRSRFKITPGVPTDRPSSCSAVIYIDDDTTVHSNIDTAAEMPSATKIVTWNPPASNIPTLYKAWSAVDTFGPNPMANDNLQGSTSANPTEQSYFTFVFFQSGTETFGFTAVVEIEYDVVWDELKTIASS